MDKVRVTGDWTIIWQDADTGEVLGVKNYENLITDTGLSTLAGIVVGEIPANNATYLALGTGGTPPASGDTALETEGFRRIVATRRHQGGTIYFRFFVLSSQAMDNWNELGVFVYGTDIPNSGYLLNRLTPPGGIRKAANQALTVEVRIALTAGGGGV